MWYCRNWLKFVAPMAADATSARGQFSIRTGDVRIPLLNPYAMDAAGAIRLTNATLGAGPMAEQLIATANQIRSILKPGEAPAPREPERPRADRETPAPEYRPRPAARE